MPILSNASQVQLAGLLNLFPISHLRSVWPDLKQLKKEQLCEEVAKIVQPSPLANFLDTHFSTAKQHVHVFDRPAKDAPAIPTSIFDGEIIKTIDASRVLFAVRRSYGFFLPGPPAVEKTVELLWPVLVETTKTHGSIKFITLERSFIEAFAGAAYPTTKGVAEQVIVDGLTAAMQLTKCDLHKGTKALWKGKTMDAHRLNYLEPGSTVSRKMNEEKGVRETDPVLFQSLMKWELRKTTFRLDAKKKTSVKDFTVDPSEGTVVFSSYSEAMGDSDDVVNQIVSHN